MVVERRGVAPRLEIGAREKADLELRRALELPEEGREPASRLGRRDFGVNRARVEGLRRIIAKL